MSNKLEDAINVYMLPKFKNAGLFLKSASDSEALFIIDDIEISIYLDRGPEIYATISSPKSKGEATLSEVLNNYLGLSENGSLMLSERFSLEPGLRKLADIIIGEIIPLIHQNKIAEALDSVRELREQNHQEYYEKNIDAEAEMAFNEKRYTDVVELYRNKKTKLTKTQEKRLHIALRNIEV